MSRASGRFFLALPQRRNEQWQHVQPVIQVFAKLAFCHRLLQQLVGRGDDADIHLDRLCPAQAQEVALFQHAQQFGLQAEGSIADLVKKQRAAGSLFDESFLAAAGIGESPGS